MQANRTSRAAVEAVEDYTEIVAAFAAACPLTPTQRATLNAAGLKAHWLTAKADAQTGVMLVAGRGGPDTKRYREVVADFERTYGNVSDFAAYLRTRQQRPDRDTDPSAA